MKGDSSLTDILVIAVMMIFGLVLIAALVGVIYGVIQNTTLSAVEQASRGLSDKIIKLNSTPIDQVSYIYVLPNSQTGTQKFDIDIGGTQVKVSQIIKTVDNEDRQRDATDVLPHIKINPDPSKCSDVRAIKLSKNGNLITPTYCKTAYDVFDEPTIISQCNANGWKAADDGTPGNACVQSRSIHNCFRELQLYCSWWQNHKTAGGAARNTQWDSVKGSCTSPTPAASDCEDIGYV